MMNFLEQDEVHESEPHDDASAYDVFCSGDDLLKLTPNDDERPDEEHLTNHIARPVSEVSNHAPNIHRFGSDGVGLEDVWAAED